MRFIRVSDEQHAVLDRQRAAGEARPGAARDPRHLRARRRRTTCCTSSAVPGRTAAAGVARYCSSPSDS